jgi:uncharacterized membrane protein SpoIIM required for sporulation
MALQWAERQRQDEFTRLHRAFVEHLGFAVALVWIASGVAACYAPWLPNIRGLIDPLGRAESTSSFLFALPVVLLAGWVAVTFGSAAIRRMRVLKSQALEFALAGSIAFAIFYLAIERAVTAFLLGI